MADDLNPYRAASPIHVDEISSGQPPTMAQYMLEVDDLVTMSLYSTRKPLRTFRLGIFLGFVFIGLFLLAQPLLPQRRVGGRRATPWPFVVPMLLCALAGVWSSPPMMRRRTRRSCEKVYQGKLPWPQTVALSDEGILVTTPHAQGHTQWEGIDKIDATTTHAFFYLSQLEAVLVPARAFGSEAQFHAFVALARERWNRARAPST